jgi:hypothetical protein
MFVCSTFYSNTETSVKNKFSFEFLASLILRMVSQNIQKPSQQLNPSYPLPP